VFEYKPDYEETKKRIAAFWERELIDRPVVQFAVPKPVDEQAPLPESTHGTADERWLDVEYQTKLACARLSNMEFLGDTLPIAFPNLGPEVLSAMYGCPIHFGDYGTSWTDPILGDWSQLDSLSFDWNSPYLNKLHAMTDALLEAGRGKFIVGMTDWHPGADGVAAWRDPETLALDMILHPDEVRRALDIIEKDYFAVYDVFYEKLRAAGQPITTWLSLMDDGKYYVPSNDFSIMVSEAMFNDMFLPGITRECGFLDRSIYHLDGPGALRHLDAILSIDALDALQYVAGDGNWCYARWVDVYRRVQAAGKAIEVFCELDEIDHVLDTLDPHGLYLNLFGTLTRDQAEGLLRKLEQWCVGKIWQGAAL